MALIAGGEGDAARRRPAERERESEWYRIPWRGRPEYWYRTPWSPYTLGRPASRINVREQPWARRLAGPQGQGMISESWFRQLPGRAIWPEEEAQYVPPSGPPPLGPPVQRQAPRPQVTVRVETEPQPPATPAWGQPAWGSGGGGWGGGWGGGGGGAPAAPSVPEVAPTPWWDIYRPFRETMSGPTRELWIRPQDWAAIPREVRRELARWLRMMGWRPGGVWGRYGALQWTRGEAMTPYWGEEAFATLPERYKAWIWWLFGAKGFAPERERPAVQGWTW